MVSPHPTHLPQAPLPNVISMDLGILFLTLRAGGVAQGGEPLPSKIEGLSSNPSTSREKKAFPLWELWGHVQMTEGPVLWHAAYAEKGLALDLKRFCCHFEIHNFLQERLTVLCHTEPCKSRSQSCSPDPHLGPE
jgi:hypothetical protein